MHAAIDQINVRLAVVGLEDELSAIGKDQADSHCHEDLHEVRAITDRPYQHHVDEIAEDKKRNAGGKKSEIRIQLEVIKENVSGIHAHHEKCAMSEVDDAHDAEDERQAHADDGIKRPRQQSISTGL